MTARRRTPTLPLIDVDMGVGRITAGYDDPRRHSRTWHGDHQPPPQTPTQTIRTWAQAVGLHCPDDHIPATIAQAYDDAHHLTQART